MASELLLTRDPEKLCQVALGTAPASCNCVLPGDTVLFWGTWCISALYCRFGCIKWAEGTYWIDSGGLQWQEATNNVLLGFSLFHYPAYS